MLAQGRLTPWIENLIGSFGRDEGASVGPLKAHVIGVGHMSQSQALDSEGPTGLLFLSDEQVQIPAVLTASAWENLQDREDRECFSSLLNYTVGIQDYKMRFHMSSEQSRSRFYLLVGKLVTTAVGVRDNTPCCTSLPSVRTKICQTWRAMLGQDHESQMSECPFTLTELLGEWQQDCLQTELEHVREKLSSVNPQSSTSSVNSDLPDTHTATSWDTDNARYKKIKRFGVPVQFLLIPDTGGQQNLQSKTSSENMKMNTQSKASPEAKDLQTGSSETEHQSTSNDWPNVIKFTPVVLSTTDMSPMSNPWDMCPPPTTTASSTDISPESTPSPHSPIITEPTTDLCPLETSTQVSAPSEESQRELNAEPSLFPPYQRPPASIHHHSTTSPRQFAKTRATEPAYSTIQEPSNEEPRRKSQKPLREKSIDLDVSVILDDDQEEQINRSPPSWLFDSQMTATSHQNTSQNQVPIGQLTKVYPCVHPDGKPFYYTYQVKGQELQHFSGFTVRQNLQQWAVRYLLKPSHIQHTPPQDTFT